MSAEEVIALHWICGCGEASENVEENAAHVVSELKRAGYAVVKLPEPSEREDHGVGFHRSGDAQSKNISEWGVFACTEDGLVYDQNDCLSPGDARIVGAWWLAAADAAENGPGVVS